MKWLLVGFSGVALLSGCGSAEPVPEPVTPDSVAEVRIVADDPADRKIGIDLRDYMEYNCPGPGMETPPMKEAWGPKMRAYVERQFEASERMCSSVRSIGVEESKLTVKSGLEGSDLGPAGEAFCGLVRGSDVADSTPGHELLDADGTTITVCGTRNAYR